MFAVTYSYIAYPKSKTSAVDTDIIIIIIIIIIITTTTIIIIIILCNILLSQSIGK
jgi:hypothetical protein